MGRKGKIQTWASSEAMRWADDEEASGPIFKQPGMTGNEFDIRMSGEADGMAAAKKIVNFISERGVCLCEANAPQQLLESAYFEAEELWEDGAFGPPLRVHDDRSMIEAQLWGQSLKDEEKVVWIRDGPGGSQSASGMNALKLLAKNMSDFAGGLAELLRKEMGIEFDRVGHAMLSCYAGDREYALHVDNAHGDDEDESAVPDNGMRLTCTYYINPHWEPQEGEAGGLDVFMTDPKEAPASAGSAKKAPRLRVAPHADTLVLMLSERMAHRVVPTRGKDTKWFALTLWGLSANAMNQMAKKIMTRRQRASKQDSDDDD
mmetsp:Transcript_120467/g.300536  ORF Transcript_120467/g.300536 Transcript_120467/m.300536 type:complete len:318 (-) Transcript_120467:58-1011(-)